MHVAKGLSEERFFLYSENLSQSEGRHFLSIKNMGLTQIHTCIFVSKKDEDQVPPV